MTANTKMAGTASSFPAGLAVGGMMSVVITILFSTISAYLISSELILQEHIGYCSIITLIASTIIGALTAAGRIKRQRLMVCLLSSCIYYLILFGMTALFFGGQYQGMGVTLVVVSLAGFAAAFVAGRERNKAQSRRRKKSHR